MQLEIDLQGSVGPVTALCVYKSHILAGCGSVVQVYQAGTCALETSLVALQCSAIHGFRLGPVLEDTKHLCVFGAKCLQILYMDEKTVRDKTSGSAVSQCVRLNAAANVKEFEDWIWDVAWLQSDDSWTVGLALAHNTVVHWGWETGTILHKVTCMEKCILYCAHLIGSNWSDLVLAAGTVFNQVVLWSPSSGHHGDGDQPQPVLHRLTGHKGVIFSIFYHPGLQRLCSVSDDRSIIMYQLCFPAPSSGDVSESDGVKVMDWNRVTFEQMLNVFGHSGRVWDVVLLSDVFVSVGEDAHCVVWSYSGDIIHKHRGHKGRSIWSLAASQDEAFVLPCHEDSERTGQPSVGILRLDGVEVCAAATIFLHVSGGGDGSIRQWRLQGKSDLPLSQVHLTLPGSVKVVAEDFVRTLALWDSDNVVLVTNAGSVVNYMIPQNQWQLLVHDADFSSYSTLACSTDGSYIAIASIGGHVRVLRKTQGGVSVQETKTSLHCGKICGLTWVSQDHFLSTGLQGQCVLAAVQHTPEGSLVVFPVARLVLPSCKHRWVVSGCLLSVPASAALKTSSASLVCGDRNGGVHSYLLQPSTTAQDQEALLPVQTFPKIHGSSGVTCVCYHDNTVLTAGRDGQYRRWAISQGHLQLLNSSRVFKGFDWIDRLWVGESGLYILGFYSSKFVVWEQRSGERLLEVECGGGHRSWDCQPVGQGYRFVFIKAREVVMVTAGHNSNQVIVKPPLHGMKVWDMKHVCSCRDSEGGVHHVMCTGSEDTTLSLGTLHCPSEGSLQWSGQHMLHAHLSSIRALAAVPSAHNAPGHQEALPDSWRCPPSTGWQNQKVTVVGREDVQGSRPTSTAVVFSAGGRAQLQAWRVKAGEQTDHSHDASPACSASPQHQGHEGECSRTPEHQTGEKMCPETARTKLNARPNCVTSLPHNPGGSSSNSSFAKPTLDKTAVTNRAPGCEEMPATCGARHSCVRITYQHLGGCFLGESRHKRQRKPWKTRYLKLDPETRIMSLAAVAACKLDHRLPACWYLLAAAGSDGILRLFLFDESSQHFTLLCQSSHHNGCILKVFLHLHPIAASCLTHPVHLHPMAASCLTHPVPSGSHLHPMAASCLTHPVPSGSHLHPMAASCLTHPVPSGSHPIAASCLTHPVPSGSHLHPIAASCLSHPVPSGSHPMAASCLSHPVPSGSHPMAASCLTHPVPSGSHLTTLTHHSAPHPFLLSAATDGQIAVWNLRPMVQSLLQHADRIPSGSKLSPASSSASKHSPDLTVPENSSKRSSSSASHPSSDVLSTSLTLSKDREKASLSNTDHGDGQEANRDHVGSGDGSDESSDEEGREDDSDGGKSASSSNVPSRPVRAQHLVDRPLLSLRHGLAGTGAPASCSAGVSGGDRCWAPSQVVKGHQSGVNSIHCKSLTDGSLLLVSGGDDNALTVHRLSLTTARETQGAGSVDTGPRQDGHLVDVVSVASKSDAHAAQITGAWVLSSRLLVTASIDQRVNVWSLSQDFQLKLEGSRYVDIADLSNMEVWQYGNHVYLGVCGEGICLLTLQGDTDQKTI